MKRKSSKYLEFYKECMKTGEMPEDGLCLCDEFYEDKALDVFIPIGETKHTTYWAAGVPENHKQRMKYFTPLRQTIVLFMHEMTVNPIL